MSSPIDFPRLVRSLRETLGLTQEELARELDTTYGSINRWENGRSQPIRAYRKRLLDLAARSGVKPHPRTTRRGLARRTRGHTG